MSEITLSKTNRDHSFDIELACIHCPEKAILLKNFDYWARENERRQLPEYFLAGKYWTSESLNSLCKKYPYMKKTSIHRWLNELNEQGWLSMVKRQGDISFFRPGPVFNLWNNGENWQVYQNGTPLKSEVEVFQNGTVGVPKWNSRCSKMEYNNIDNNIELNIDSESKDSHCALLKNQETKNEIPEPKSEKKSKQKTPGGRAGAGAKTENWAKRAAQIFDEVNREKATEAQIEFIPYEWKAKAGQDFKSLKGIKEMIERAIAQKGMEPTSENVENSFRLFFRCGFDYLHEIAERLGGPITFSPSTLQRNYNQIRQFSTNKFKSNATHKRDNGPGNGSSGTGRYGIDIDRAMQDVSNILNDRGFMASIGA